MEVLNTEKLTAKHIAKTDSLTHSSSSHTISKQAISNRDNTSVCVCVCVEPQPKINSPKLQKQRHGQSILPLQAASRDWKKERGKDKREWIKGTGQEEKQSLQITLKVQSNKAKKSKSYALNTGFSYFLPNEFPWLFHDLSSHLWLLGTDSLINHSDQFVNRFD